MICSISWMAWLTRLRIARSMNTRRNLASASLSSRSSMALDSARLLARVGLQVIFILSGVSLILSVPSTVMHLSRVPLKRKLMGYLLSSRVMAFVCMKLVLQCVGPMAVMALPSSSRGMTSVSILPSVTVLMAI